MSKQEKKKRREKRKSKSNSPKSHASIAKSEMLQKVFEFSRSLEGIIPEAKGFPSKFRDIVFTNFPKKLECSSDLTGIQIELKWFDSIIDRSNNENGYITLVGEVESCTSMPLNSKSSWIPSELRRDGHIIWRVKINLVEYIEIGTNYGNWSKVQGQLREGLSEERVEVDILIHIKKENIKNLTKDDDTEDCTFYAANFSFSPNGVIQLSSIQVDAIWFLTNALVVSIPNLSSDEYSFKIPEKQLKSRIAELNEEEASLILQHSSLISRMRTLKSTIESLLEPTEVESGKTRSYRDFKINLEKKHQERRKYQSLTLEIDKRLLAQNKELHLKTLLFNKALQNKTDQEAFKKAFLEKKVCEDCISMLQAETKEHKKVIIEIDIEIKKWEKRIRLLESELYISKEVVELEKLELEEVALMTKLDRCFMERIILLVSYNTWASRMNKAPIQS